MLAFIQPLKKEGFKPVVVLELFTSQGCSSCPPADELLNNVKNSYKDTNVIVLSYHVDYWNYIGWKDPFSKKEFSDKQRAYSTKFFSSSIYTPQVVVNGKEHFVGSNKTIMNTKLKTYKNKLSENKVSIDNVIKNMNTISFTYDVDGELNDKLLRVALVISDRETKVSRGENRHRVLKNSNIVVQEIYIELNTSSKEANITIPEIVLKNDNLSLIALVENKDLDITGGSQIAL